MNNKQSRPTKKETKEYLKEVGKLTGLLIKKIDSMACNPSLSEEKFKEWQHLKATAILSAESARLYANDAVSLSISDLNYKI